MNHSFHEKPAELTIDVEQWKRDIQTFAEATSKALNAIAAELSNTCSNGRTTTSQRDVTNPTNEIQPSQSSKFEASHSNSDGRLEKLKLQLASRISKTN